MGIVTRFIPGFTPSATPDPDITLDEFFDPQFMVHHTQFPSFEAFCEHSPWVISGPSDIDRIPRERLDSYVARTTSFETWQEMRNRAAGREIRDRLLL